MICDALTWSSSSHEGSTSEGEPSKQTLANYPRRNDGAPEKQRSKGSMFEPPYVFSR